MSPPPGRADDSTIRALTPELLKDFLAFFDHDAFADNPDWAPCYCRCHHFPHHEQEWGKTTLEENRAAVIDLIRRGELRGYLAYRDGQPIGWCNAGPRSSFTTTSKDLETGVDRIGSIVCFVIANAYWKQGLAAGFERVLACCGDGDKAIVVRKRLG